MMKLEPVVGPSRFRPFWQSLAVASVLVAFAGPAMAQSVENGAVLAERWCNACHYTGVNEPHMHDAGPQFVTLADKNTEYLLNAIVRPHDFMPSFPRLGYSDMVDLVAFIQSLE
jgi:mono/diheme cytochrome c family protein